MTPSNIHVNMNNNRTSKSQPIKIYKPLKFKHKDKFDSKTKIL